MAAVTTTSTTSPVGARTWIVDPGADSGGMTTSSRRLATGGGRTSAGWSVAPAGTWYACATCTDCAAKIRECSQCHGKIEKRLRVYIAGS